jgi:hypothetical protein
MDYGYNQDPYSEMEYYQRQQALARQQQQQQPTPLQSLGNLAANKLKDKAVSYGIDKVGSMLGGGDVVASAYPSVFNSGASAVTQLPTGGITPLLNGGGYAGIGEGGVLTQGAAVPTTPGFGAAAGSAAGLAVAGYNVMDALGNIGSRNGKGTVEGIGTGIGTAAGAYFGGPIGAGIGSVLGRTAGRGIASVADKFGAFQKSTQEYQQDKTEDLRKAGIRDEFIQSRIDGGFGSKYVDNPESYGRANGMNDSSGVLTEAGKKDAASNWGSPDILKAIGNDYFDKYNERQRYQITQGALDRGLLKGHKGDVVLTDEDAFLGTVESSVANEEYGKMYDAWKAKFGPSIAQNLANKATPAPQSQAGAQSGSTYPEGMFGPGQPQNAIWKIDPGMFQNYNIQPWAGGVAGLNAETAKRENIAKSLLSRHKARMGSK